MDSTISATKPQLYRFAGRLGWKDFIKRLDLIRYLNYPFVLQHLQVEQGMDVLDVGVSNSIFPVYLASHGCRVVAIDMDEHRLNFQRARLPGLQGRVIRSGTLRFESQDARELPYPDGAFHRITIISTIEHVPDDGDMMVSRELARVLRPGGRIVYTMPYGRTFFPGSPPYSTSTTQRIYDDPAITTRLVQSSALRELGRFYIVDRWFDFEFALWRRIPYQIHNLTGWTGLGMLCAKLFFKAYQPAHDGRNSRGAGLVLEKPTGLVDR
jgi:SAM-dependent methyltransferase